MDLIVTRLCYLILLFFVFSVAGWCMEVALKYRQYHRFINRGFLIGPYCPIYGSGAVFITLTAGAFSRVESSYGTTFGISFIVCGVLEYLVSYFLEKRFHARWWDYSQKPMNLHGRIWIGNLIWFGIGGTVIIKVANPVLFALFMKIPGVILHTAALAILLLMAGDYVMSHIVLKFVKTSVEHSEADNTESISKEIRLLLKDKSVLYRRLADAYPDVTYHTERINRKMQEIRAEVEHMKQEAAKRVEDAGTMLQNQKNNLGMMLTPSSEIRDEIIERQDELIALLYQKDIDEEAVQRMQTAIQEKKTQLENRKKLLSITREKNEEKTWRRETSES